MTQDFDLFVIKVLCHQIFKTMKKIITENTIWRNGVLDEFRNSKNHHKEVLNDVMFVFVESKANGANLQDFTGVNTAIEILKSNAQEKILLAGFTPLEWVRKKKPEIDILLSKDTVRFVELPLGLDDIIQVWQTTKPCETNTDALGNFTASQIAMVLHGLKVADYTQPKDEREVQIVQEVAARGRETFPFLKSYTNDQDVIAFLIKANTGRPEVRKGEFLDGVFCDIEGTLLLDGNINQKILEMLRTYEAEGKTVTLWTDGDIAKLSEILLHNGITYPLHAKTEFAGAQVAIAIDDMDEFTFNAHTKILPKKFVQV